VYTPDAMIDTSYIPVVRQGIMAQIETPLETRRNATKEHLMETKNITALEFAFISDLSCSDFAFECGIEKGIVGYVNSGEGFDMNRVRGVMSSLVQKGYVEVDDASFIEFGSTRVTRDTWAMVTDKEINNAIYEMWYPEVA
jgi:hypothetical protein